MANVMNLRHIDRRNKIPGIGEVEFLRAEMPEGMRVPFVLIRYSVHGKEQRLALRLDLHKAAFLDHLEDACSESAIQSAAPRIVALLRQAN
jgi:hypothetical protein